MHTRFLPLVLACLLWGTAVQSQAYGYGSPGGFPYFQQHVHYTLDVTLNSDPSKPTIDGTGSLEYQNNSQDTLQEVYFHLYWNLFKNGSYGEKAPNRDHTEDEKYGSDGITIKKIGQIIGGAVVDNTPEAEVDNTIMRIRLAQPILPGETRTFTFEWTGELPNFEIRSTWGYHDHGARNMATAQFYPQ